MQILRRSLVFGQIVNSFQHQTYTLFLNGLIITIPPVDAFFLVLGLIYSYNSPKVVDKMCLSKPLHYCIERVLYPLPCIVAETDRTRLKLCREDFDHEFIGPSESRV